MGKLRKTLSAPGLLATLGHRFGAIRDARAGTPTIPLRDALLSGLAVFGLKCPSLLQFDQQRHDPAVAHNLRTLYGVKQVPCDSQLREILDRVAPRTLRPAFKALFAQLQRGKVLEAYQYLGGYYLVSVDGTGFFSSTTIHCDHCCVKKDRAGEETYYHQLLGAVIVHPDHREVFPLAPEPITRQDGDTKNDCERNAAKRLLRDLRREHPHLPLIVVEDALSANAPHIQLLKELKMRFILGVKPGDHAALFAYVEQRAAQQPLDEYTLTDAAGVRHRFRWVNSIPLNQQHPELTVNFLEYWEERPKKTLHFTWVTDFPLSTDTVFDLMRGGRARWKIENETLNTLKNQDYHFEHNFGHGDQHLATNFSLLMMLAFLVDQIQAHCCAFFQQAWQASHSKIRLWARMRAFFTDFYIASWKQFFMALIHGPALYELLPDTS
ncbi:MAG: transposase [Gallionella sp.]|nr:transposase [Gallionella sp.]